MCPTCTVVAADTARQMDPEAVRSLVGRFVDAFNRRDEDAFVTLMDPDYLSDEQMLEQVGLTLPPATRAAVAAGARRAAG